MVGGVNTPALCELCTPDEISAAISLAQQEPHVARYASQLENAAKQPEAELWGLYEGSLLLGYLVMTHGVFDAEIESVAVLPTARGNGVGRHLVAHACKRAHLLNRERVLLEVRESNRAAIRLYRRQGFVKDGVRRSYYDPLFPGGTRDDAVLMSYSFVSS